ncbi:hypothetical protein ALC62_00423 [Cyphomyrmex costatus]|uniref:Uncharacterized protein n=1 Tax=Cyphomyrmex costatus TaxID=456900 RepID=A0A151IQT3_9HYME|nr:hypothetical protein ALC62_00423 [Cyphomyrmex costatus]
MTVLAIGHGCGCAICATVSSRLPVFRVVTPDRLLTSDNDFENRAPSLCEQRRVGIHNARTQTNTFAAAATTACGVKNTCAAKHAAILRSAGRPKEASISPLIDRSAGASDKILSSFWSCPTHRRPSDGPHASCKGQGKGDSPLPAARGPPTSWAQRRYLAEGKSLLDHPHRLLVAGAWATLFQGAHLRPCLTYTTSPPLRSAKRRIPPSRIHHADRGVGPTWVVPVLRKQSTALSGGRTNAGVRRRPFTPEHAPPGRIRGPRRGPVIVCERDDGSGNGDVDDDGDTLVVVTSATTPGPERRA